MATVLLVEHDPAARHDLRRAIEDNYKVREAASPVEALNVCRLDRAIDVLVCDAELGLVSGMELASLLRAWLPHVRTVLLSDLPCDQWTDRQETELRELPAEDVFILQKPCRPIDLRMAVSTLAVDLALSAT